MESPYATIFLALQERILAEVPEIKYIDQNLGQYMNEKFRESMLFPCILVDFPQTTFSAMQGFNQLADVTVVVTVFYDIWNNTSSITPLHIKEAGLKYLETDQKVFMALHGWSPDFCTEFVRGQTKSQNANDIGLVVREITYSSSFEDYSPDDHTPQQFLNLRTE